MTEGPVLQTGMPTEKGIYFVIGGPFTTLTAIYLKANGDVMAWSLNKIANLADIDITKYQYAGPYIDIFSTVEGSA